MLSLVHDACRQEKQEGNDFIQCEHWHKFILKIFFFERYGAHRDLHSFPTRRSSDLRVVPESCHAWSRPLPAPAQALAEICRDRKSTRLNSSHMSISYAVFCLKK